MKALILFPLAAFVLSAVTQAVTINVDFNTASNLTYTGTAVLGGGIWNGVVNTPANGLLDSTGAVTTINANIGSSTFDGFRGGNVTAAAANDLLREYRNQNNGTMTLTLTGLLANGTYNLVMYAAGDQVVQGSTFSGSGYTGGPTTGVQRNTFALGDNYSQGTVTADSAGAVTITIAANKAGANATNTYAVLNGFQISDIPEPSAALLGLLGSVILFGRRRNG